jgi:hypothetical protein
MKKSFLFAIFCALFLTAIEARANIYGLLVLAENPALNLMQGTSLMLMSYEEGAYYRPYLEAYQFEGQVFRSGGASGAFDCYPAYPGICAVVPTQTEFDVLNSDPSILEGDFYIDTVFVQQVAPGVYYGYDPAYYFGFGGGEYPPEFTFAPCWCGGYVQVVRIYLGTLGLVFPKPEVFTTLEDVDDTILAAMPDRIGEIPRTNQTRILSGNILPVMIGERYQLGFTIRNRPSGFVDWIVGGKFVESWNAMCGSKKDPQTCGPTEPITSADTTSPNLARTRPIVMWYVGSFQGLFAQIIPRFTLYGRLYGGPAGAAQVFAPNVNVTASYENTIAVRNTFRSPTPDFSNFYTCFGVRRTGDPPGAPGIRFTLTSQSIPSGFAQGFYQWVQVVESGGYTESNSNLGNPDESYTTFGLDTTYPYRGIDLASITDTSDSPNLRWTLQNGKPSHLQQDFESSFTMYLMYLPVSTTNLSTRWVPVKAYTWGFNVTATAITDVLTGSMQGGNVNFNLEPIAPVPNIDFPRWTRNAINLIPQ